MSEQDEELGLMVLRDEEGKECKFAFLGVIDYDKKEYIFLLPYENGKETEEVVILQVEDNGDDEEETYISVDDDKLLDFLFDLFKEENKDLYNFVD